VSADVLSAAARDLDFDVAPPEVVTVELHNRPGVPADPAEALFALEAGLFDLIAESAEGSSPEENIARLEETLRPVQALAAITRFGLFERLETMERLERTARMNGLANAMTRGWMLPRLREDIRLYAERIDALQRAIEEVAP